MRTLNARDCRRYRCTTGASAWGWLGPGPVMSLQVRLFRFRSSALVIAPLQACLRYVTNSSQIDRVVVAVDTAAQLNQIVEAADGKFATLPEFPNLQDTRLINPASWNQL